MLFDIQEKQIYTYPYVEFKKDLNSQSKDILEKQYIKAIFPNKLVMYVKAHENQKLV